MTLPFARRARTTVAAATYLGLISNQLEEVDETFRQALSSDVPFVQSAGEYIFQGGGKRVRPAMLLLSARLLGRSDDPAQIAYAAVVEMVHSATLIHDDIIDGAKLRRGRPAINHLWGNSRTVLLGDWLFTTAVDMALEHGDIEVVRRLCNATGRMTEGELLSLDRLGAIDLDREEYFHIIERKTAQLFSAACAVPAISSPRDRQAEEALGRYGRSLGICFQLVDDLLDFTAEVRELGKPVLSDLCQGKLTLPLILVLPRVDDQRRQLVRTVLEDGDFGRVSADQILELVRSEGTLDEVSEIAEAVAEEARAELAELPACDARDALEAAPDFVLRRRS